MNLFYTLHIIRYIRKRVLSPSFAYEMLIYYYYFKFVKGKKRLFLTDYVYIFKCFILFSCRFINDVYRLSADHPVFLLLLPLLRYRRNPSRARSHATRSRAPPQVDRNRRNWSAVLQLFRHPWPVISPLLLQLLMRRLAPFRLPEQLSRRRHCSLLATSSAEAIRSSTDARPKTERNRSRLQLDRWRAPFSAAARHKRRKVQSAEEARMTEKTR